MTSLERKTGCGRSYESRFRKKSHLGGGIKKQHLLDAALFGAENETRAHGRGRSRAFFVTPNPLKGDVVARASHRFQQT